MPNQQFDERPIVLTSNLFDDTQAANSFFGLEIAVSGQLRLDIFQIVTDDTAINEVIIYHKPGPNEIPIGSVAVPAGAGYNGVPPVDVLHALFGDTFHYIIMEQGTTLGAALVNALTSGKTMTFLDAGGYV